MKYYVMPRKSMPCNLRESRDLIIEDIAKVNNWHGVLIVELPVIGTMRLKIEKESVYLNGYINHDYFIVDDRHIGGTYTKYHLHKIIIGIANGDYTLQKVCI